MILALSRQILEGFWKPAIESIADSNRTFVSDAVVFQACEFVIMHERSGHEEEFANLSSKFAEVSEILSLRGDRRFARYVGSKSDNACSMKEFSVTTKEELGEFRPEWLDTEEAQSYFDEAKAMMLQVKSTKSGFEKLKVLASSLDSLYKSLDASQVYQNKTIGGK